MALKTAVLAAMPRPMIRMAITVKSGEAASRRRP